jgi:hypothetical protein
MYILMLLMLSGYGLAAPQYDLSDAFETVVDGVTRTVIPITSIPKITAKPDSADPEPTIATTEVVTEWVTEYPVATETEIPLQQAEPTQDSAVNGTKPSYQDTKTTGDGYCGASTFEDRTSGSSPSVEDCLHIASNIAGGGRWDIDMFLGKQKRIAEYKSCAFGVQGHPISPGEIKMYIGNEDIIDIINDAVEKFGGGGQIGAKGIMECKDSKDRLRIVDWGIYHR